MKKIIHSLILILIANVGYSQTLEKRHIITAAYYKYSQTEDGFAYFDKSTNAIIVLNSSNQFVKSLPCSFVDANASLIYISKLIINSNDKYKYVIAHNKAVSIYDEDQNLIFNRDSAYSAKFINTSSGPKMLILSTYGWQEVYSITGLLLKVNTLSNENNEIIVYPNPSKQFTTIKLNNNIKIESPILTITDINGTEVARYIVDPLAKETTINIDFLNNGIYFYKVIGKDYVSRSEKLIIE
jgi:hypothetical protein